MSIKFTKDGELAIDLHSLLNQVSGEDKIALIESLSCDEEIIKHVTDQILEGFTENGYFGSTGFGESEPRTALDRARREIAKGASELAKEEIGAMENRVKSEKEWGPKIYGCLF
jgi:hypothetical protein